jgi:hypothetical protein
MNFLNFNKWHIVIQEELNKQDLTQVKGHHQDIPTTDHQVQAVPVHKDKDLVHHKVIQQIDHQDKEDHPQVTQEPLNKDHKVQEMPHLPEISSATQTPFNAEKFDTVR